MAKKNRPIRAPRNGLNGKPVVDAGMPLVLTIERGDIRGAKAGSPEKCGAARAIVRQEAGAIAAHVFRAVTYVEYNDRVERFATPARLRQETISFDRGAPDKFLEGDYRLLPPSAAHKLGADRRPGRPGGADKRRAPAFDVEGGRPKSPHTHAWLKE